MVRLLVSTGEVSGDLQGALLIRALLHEARQRGIDLELVALGGQRMQMAGATVLENTEAMGAIGLWEPLPFVASTLLLQARLTRWMESHPLDGVVLVDYMGANVGLGRRIKKQYNKVPIFYYIAPQEWAYSLWEGRTTSLISFTDLILAIFPEEARFYGQRGASVTWVGHPLIDTLGDLPSKEQARLSLDLPVNAPVLLMLPASRRQELRYLLPAMAKAAAILQKRHPFLQVLVPAGQASFEKELEQGLAVEGVKGRVIAAKDADNLKPVLCAAADGALTKSGTANLELALRGVPQVTGYRVSRPTAFLAHHLLRFQVPHISPVNLILEERLVPELLQNELTPQALVDQIEPLMECGSRQRQQILNGYYRLRKALGKPGVTQRAANTILDRVLPVS